MSTYLCPKGHASTEPDYCSECGTKINGVAQLLEASQSAATPTLAAQACPDCGTPHESDGGTFCEICGYNFVSGAHGEVPMAVTHPPIPDPISGDTVKQTDEAVQADQAIAHSSSAVQVSPDEPQRSPVAWELIITVDPSLRHPDSPAPPTDQSPITLRLDKDSNLIGRTSQKRAIYPEIALDVDEAVSHRHALLIRQPDGSLTLRDIGSSNGTSKNGAEIAALTDIAIANGDEITLGHWTRIIVKQY